MSIANFIIDIIPVDWIDKYITLKSKDPIKFDKFVLNSNPDILESIGQKKAIYIFKKAANNIKFYNKFLRKNKVNFQDIKNIEDFNQKVPPIDKVGYIRNSKKLHDLCLPEHSDEPELLVRSSGFTGNPQTWIESKKEIENSRRYVRFGLNFLFNTKKYSTLVINGFSLGSWASGISFLTEVEGKFSIINPGLKEQEIIELISQLKGDYEQFIITGNPVFLKNLIDECINEKIDIRNNKIDILTAGESITEGWREYLDSKLNSKKSEKYRGNIFSAFGASDIGIVGFNETPASIKIRKLALSNKKIRKEIFDDDKILPMLFQYDPTKYYITQNDKQELEFTTCGSDVVMPLIKYNLHDIGGTISYNKMKEHLNKFGYKLDINLPFPFLYIGSRSDGSLSYCSSNIYPSTIQQAIYSHKNLSKYTTGKFRLSKKFLNNHDAYIHIDIQLEKKKSPNKKLNNLFEKVIYRSLLKSNPDFKEDITALTKKGKKILEISLHKFENYKDPQSIKVRYLE